MRLVPFPGLRDEFHDQPKSIGKRQITFKGVMRGLGSAKVKTPHCLGTRHGFIGFGLHAGSPAAMVCRYLTVAILRLGAEILSPAVVRFDVAPE
jgi:hypothetical protein